MFCLRDPCCERMASSLHSFHGCAKHCSVAVQAKHDAQNSQCCFHRLQIRRLMARYARHSPTPPGHQPRRSGLLNESSPRSSSVCLLPLLGNTTNAAEGGKVRLHVSFPAISDPCAAWANFTCSFSSLPRGAISARFDLLHLAFGHSDSGNRRA